MVADMTALALGFSAVMLILGLLVTSLSQATQAALRLRGRNLRHGLASALMATDEKPDRANLREASEILNWSNRGLLSHWSDPNSFRARLLGPPVSWLDEADLRKLLYARAEKINAVTKPRLEFATIDAAIEDIVHSFEASSPSQSNRYKRLMRGVSLGWSLAVAAVFQLSAPDLLRQMTTTPTYIDIAPLRHGWAFYTNGIDSAANILGVLVTALLLALGAAFCYRVLTDKKTP